MGDPMDNLHIGRSFGGPGHLEEGCPCHKAPCGLVDGIDPECTEHPFARGKTIRVGHMPQECPGGRRATA